jgi:alkylation response protein AidB-like acyl-CoA dehydrogenase
MRFLPDAEQAEFARTLDRMLAAADTPSATRGWGAGEHAAGRALWGRLAQAGVFALGVPEAYEGLGPLPVELALAFVELGRHAVPGPVVETVAVAALLGRLGGAVAKDWLPRIAAGQAVVTLTMPEGGPYALDADAADAVFVADAGQLALAIGHGPVRASLDPARRLFRPQSPVGGGEPLTQADAAYAAGWAAFLTAAQSLGVGLALLRRSVEYAKQRRQFGTAIGSFQAVKHRLADTFTALEFARPLLLGAAVTQSPADIAAAKLACGEAAYAAARSALQVHGAIGYTAEYDLSLWITKARALRTAWGSPSACRAAVLRSRSEGARTPVPGPRTPGAWRSSRG